MRLYGITLKCNTVCYTFNSCHRPYIREEKLTKLVHPQVTASMLPLVTGVCGAVKQTVIIVMAMLWLLEVAAVEL